MAYVDVIMSAYNEKNKIGSAIESILSQSYDDWRLIVCDDGSKDGTFEVIKLYEKHNSDKILAIKNEENRGLTYTLNRMLKLSNAKYIARMDADDKSRPDRIKKQVDFLDAHTEYAMVGSVIIKFDEEGPFSTVMLPEKPEVKDFYWNSPFAHPSIMIRKEVIDKLGGYWDEPRTQRCEDYDLWMRLYEAGYKGYNIQEPIFEYYEGRNSYRKRKLKYRIAEMRTRFYGYRRLRLMPLGIVYTIKPLVVGLIPSVCLVKMRKGRKQ